MDLMEYQAKELFAKHGVATTLGIVVDHARRRPRAAAEELGWLRGQGPGQGGRPRQGRRREARQDPRRGRSSTRRTSSAWRSRGSPSTGCWSPRRPRRWRSTTSPSCSTAPTAQYLCIASVEGGVEIEEVAKTNPDAVKQISIDPRRRCRRRRRPREIVDGGRLPRGGLRAGGHDDRGAVRRSSSRRTPPSSRSTRWRGWPATGSRRSTARSRSTTTPTFRHADHAPFEVTRTSRPARGQGQGEGPQLRQARRRGRDHRQRRGPGHVDPRRRGVRRRAARRREAGELPRHRRRRQRRR